ncbi:MAG: hypothetical protein A2Z29_08330 [Chloroflexi bacterium RBG_16_56_11]|nr:MAG: hypothetical protein A2Z29_08330 [Chloroflexi bacterium RBG_16_56_11]
MINPHQVGLIIFDLHGTVSSSTRAVYEALKSAYRELGWDMFFSQQEMEKHLGETSDAFYQQMTPAEKRSQWKELRTRVREQNINVFREYGQTFPGVTETLKTLKERGFRLALYSTSSRQSFNAAIDALEITDFFEPIECAQENNLTKTELARKFKVKTGTVAAAIVGDSLQDIEAARGTDSLSIGALYGYGGNEPQQADITIKQFDKLLTIFDRRLPIFENILGEIGRKKAAGRPYVVGISGIDCSGKSLFAGAFEKFLQAKGHQTQLISLDDFHNPKEIRCAGKDQADNYYNRSFNINLIKEKLLKPLRGKKAFSVRMTLLDWRTDRYEIEREFSFSRDTIVIFEGVFLFRNELAPHIDYKVFLSITFEESKKRAKERDAEAVIKKYDNKYLPAQRKYLEEYPPRKTADIVIDNTDYHRPHIM